MNSFVASMITVIHHTVLILMTIAVGASEVAFVDLNFTLLLKIVTANSYIILYMIS